LDVPDDTRGAAIVHGLLSLGHALGLSVVGEGVETEAQAEALRQMGCELAQGYFYAYPGTAKQLWANLRPAEPPMPAVQRAAAGAENVIPMAGRRHEVLLER
jgi:EAL domain-containing protein (putative c-di-GMP-specific phosphodiesterase class I)